MSFSIGNIFTKANLSDACKGISFGYFNYKINADEEAFRQGRNPVLTALSQMDRITFAKIPAKEFLEKWGKSVPYPLAKLNIFLVTTPLLLAYLSKKDISNNTRRVVNFIQDHISTLSTIVSLTSTIGLLVLGSTVQATASLIFLGLGVLDSKKIIPLRCRQIFHRFGFIAFSLAQFTQGDFLTKIFAVINIAGTIINKYYAYKLKNLPPEEKAKMKSYEYLPPVAVTPKDLQSHSFHLLDYKVQVNKSHLNIDILPPISSETKFSDFLTVLDRIVPTKKEYERLSKSTNPEDKEKFSKWQKHRKTLIRKCMTDRRWNEVEKLKGQTYEEFLRDSVKTVLTQIEKKKISVSEPQDYEMLTKYTLLIAQLLPNLKEEEQADILFRIGIEGGMHCGPGVFEAIEDITTKLLGYVEELPLKTRILGALQQQRITLWDQLYDLFWDLTPIHRIEANLFDSQDVHLKNMILNLSGAGEILGIPHENAKQDKVAEVPASIAYIYKYLEKWIKHVFWEGISIPKFVLVPNKNQANEDFWKPWQWYSTKEEWVKIPPYDSKCILDVISNSIGSSQIPMSDIFQWWSEWIDRQSTLTDAEKSALQKELGDYPSSLFGSPLEEITFVNGKEIRKIKKEFLAAMLLEFGVFTK